MFVKVFILRVGFIEKKNFFFQSSDVADDVAHKSTPKVLFGRLASFVDLQQQNGAEVCLRHFDEMTERGVIEAWVT